MEMGVAVDRCVCHRVTFVQLKLLADRCGADLNELQRQSGCGTSCGCCVPYIRLMLTTGRTSFPVLPRDPSRRGVEQGIAV